MRISRTEAWLLVLGAFVVSALVGLVLFLIGMAFSWFALILGATIEVVTFGGGIGYFAKAIRTVPQDERWALEVLGRYEMTLEPGLHFVLPRLEEVRKQSTREQFVSVVTKETLTLDGITLDVLGEYYYQLDLADPDSIRRAVYSFERGDDPEEAIKNLIEATTRSIVGTKEVAFLKNNQEEINRLVETQAGGTVSSWGFKGRRHLITELMLPEQIRKAMEQQLIAEREGTARVVAATADKEAVVQAAEGARQKQILAAEGDAEARIREATSKKDALNLLVEVLGKEQAVEYMLAEEQFAALAEIGKGQGTTIIPAGSEGLAQLLALGRGILGNKK